MNDPRAIANYILDEFERDDIDVTNITLQKLVYFCHAFYLFETGQPLVSGYFEAWRFGPVHPSVYRAFKKFGASKITERAHRYDPTTNSTTEIEPISDNQAIKVIRSVLLRFGGLTAGQLVDLTHAPKGPWHFVVESAKISANLGLRISDNVTIERFKHLKLAVGAAPKIGEPGEDTPFV